MMTDPMNTPQPEATDSTVPTDTAGPVLGSESSPDAELLVATNVPKPSAGGLLRAARDAQGIHLVTLSNALKVPVKKLEALEADDWATLPDPVFVRALATSVCRHIKTDSQPVLALLPPIPSPVVMDEAAAYGLNQRFIGAGDPRPSLLRMPVSIPMLLGALILLLAAVIILFLPDLAKRSQNTKSEVVEVITPVTNLPLTQSPVTSASGATTPVTETVTSVPSSVTTPLSAPLSTPSPTPVSAGPTPSPIVVSTSPSAQPSVSPSLAPVVVGPPISPNTPQPTLRMVAKGIVWVEVKDSKGTVLVQRNLQPKEVVNAFGSSPLSVVVGRINEIEAIDVRGKPFSLSGMSPDNVARFEVK
jgi:cytoskeleton protein RodZ